MDHRADFTFSLAVPAETALARLPGEQRYCEIHARVATALEQCGIATQSVGRMIPVDKIRPNPDQPRKVLGELRELTDSIKEKGVLEGIT